MTCFVQSLTYRDELYNFLVSRMIPFPYISWQPASMLCELFHFSYSVLKNTVRVRHFRIIRDNFRFKEGCEKPTAHLDLTMQIT